MEAIALYPFRFFDLRTRRWYRGRYKARLDIIAERYPAFQIIGQPELIRASEGGLTAGHLARGGR